MKKRILKLGLLTMMLFTILGCEKNYDEEINNLKHKTQELDTEIKLLKENLIDNSISDFENPFSDDTINSSTPIPHDFCNTTQSIIQDIGKSWYNTKTGFAYYQIPIPVGSKLIRVDKTETSVHYICVGKKYHSNTTTKWRLNSGFSRKVGSSLRVEVTFYFNDNDCTGENSPLGEEKKGSVIAGQPFWPDEKS